MSGITRLIKAALLLCMTLAVAFSAQAYATPINEPPPPGWILNLDGQPDLGIYTQYTVDFTATDALTNITFAMRDDPDYIYLDNIFVSNNNNPSLNLVENGDFEGGITTSGGNIYAAVGWQYLNPYGAGYGGGVDCGEGNGDDAGNDGQGGSNCQWMDGAQYAYDAISQAIATTVGDTYQISFWAYDGSGDPYWTELGDGGEGDPNITVYAGAIPFTSVPEPAALGMFGFGLILLGGFAALRRRTQA